MKIGMQFYTCAIHCTLLLCWAFSLKNSSNNWFFFAFVAMNRPKRSRSVLVHAVFEFVNNNAGFVFWICLISTMKTFTTTSTVNASATTRAIAAVKKLCYKKYINGSSNYNNEQEIEVPIRYKCLGAFITFPKFSCANVFVIVVNHF